MLSQPPAPSRTLHPVPAADSIPPIHCVVWHAPDAPPTPELTSLLAQRGLTLETCSDAYAAAARLCRAHRATRALRRAADNAPFATTPPNLPSLVLLLVEPSRLTSRDALARVLELHAPRTICWVYEQAAGPSLRTVPLASPVPATTLVPTITVARREPPPLALTTAPQVPINTPNILTDEELSMLLSDDDPPGRRSRTTSR